MSDDSRRKYYAFPPSGTASKDEPPTLAEVGGKALSLLDASAAGFPVPPGFVLSVAFFRPWLEKVEETDAWKSYINKQSKEGEVTKEECDAIKEQCHKILSLDAEQLELLERAARDAFGEEADIQSNLGVVAVRSSSPQEDLAGTSFAGGYETSLGVTSTTLQSAIVDSFASMFDHRVHLYKCQHGLPTEAPRIAVVVQRQIASDVSGVGFSINPNNNCYDEITISANFGLGESVVGGIVTPDTYIVDRFDPNENKILSKNVAKKESSVWLDADGGTRLEENGDNATEQALTDEQMLEVADLVARVELEQNGGSPVDIEWCFHNGELFLLQARPVTAYIPLFPEMVTERGEEKKLYLDVMVMTQGFSDPLSTLGLDLWRIMLAHMKPTMSTDGKDGLVWNLHGREYFQISNLLMTTAGNAMINAGIRTYSKENERAFDSIDMKDYTPSEVPEGAKGILWKTLKRLWTTLPNMFWGLYRGEKAMDEYVDTSNAIIERCYNDECSEDEMFDEAYEKLVNEYNSILPMIGCLTAGLISRGILHNWIFRSCKEEANDLLIQMCMDLRSNPTSEMGHFLVRLASFPEIQETERSEDFLSKLQDGSLSPEFLKEYNEYLKRFGCRGIREIDVATPRTHENQARLFETLKAINVEKNQIINVSERRDEAYQKLLQMARDLDKEKQFVHHAAIVQGLMGYREHPKYMIVVIVDRMRRHALNIAEEWVAQGRLEKKDQIFALTIDQVSEGQRNGDLKLLPLVKANLEPIERVAHIKNWPQLIDSRGKIIRGTRKSDANMEKGTLFGDPISPGTARGRAKVLMSPYEKPLESGEVLVARFTEPSWTPLFINAVGVVMEIGGPMQHGAIIAREYGIPCVSGIDNATNLITDGDLLEVDGSSGLARIITESTE